MMFRVFAVVFLAALAWPDVADAQSAAEQALRARPDRIIVASGPGGDTDITGRYVARTMSDQMCHTVVVKPPRRGLDHGHGIRR